MIRCAYCDTVCNNFNNYKCHLKVLHSKKSYGEQLICGQDGCVLNLNYFRSLKQQITKLHSLSLSTAGSTHSENSSYSTDQNDNIGTFASTSTNEETLESILDEIKNSHVLEDVAYFVSRLTSHASISLAAISEIIDFCKDLFASLISMICLKAFVITLFLSYFSI